MGMDHAPVCPQGQAGTERTQRWCLTERNPRRTGRATWPPAAAGSGSMGRRPIRTWPRGSPFGTFSLAILLRHVSRLSWISRMSSTHVTRPARAATRPRRTLSASARRRMRATSRNPGQAGYLFGMGCLQHNARQHPTDYEFYDYNPETSNNRAELGNDYFSPSSFR